MGCARFGTFPDSPSTILKAQATQSSEVHLTYGGDGDESSATQPRDVAREKARALREEHRKQERRRRLFLRGGIVVGIVAVALVIVFVLQGSIPKPIAGPLNMAS